MSEWASASGPCRAGWEPLSRGPTGGGSRAEPTQGPPRVGPREDLGTWGGAEASGTRKAGIRAGETSVCGLRDTHAGLGSQVLDVALPDTPIDQEPAASLLPKDCAEIPPSRPPVLKR